MDADEDDPDWADYYAAQAGRPPRPLLHAVLDRWHRAGDRPGLAINLGCGDGADTFELLRQGCGPGGTGAGVTGYGQPGIIWAWPFPRPQTWQNRRSGLVAAAGRSQLPTSAASISRPSADRGNGSPAGIRRSRAMLISPWLTASYSAP